MLNNVLVYAIAEKYGISKLKELAKTKFRNQARSILSSSEFLAIIQALYSSTPSSDRGLRDIVSQICAPKGKIIAESPDLNGSILQVGDFGLDLLRAVLDYENRRMEKEVTSNAALGEKLKKKEEEIVKLQRQASSVSKLLKKVAVEVETGRVSEISVFF